MRYPIEHSPRNGAAIILEDDASGTCDAAHWSSEAGKWLGEDGEPTKNAPTHRYPIPRDQYGGTCGTRGEVTKARELFL